MSSVNDLWEVPAVVIDNGSYLQKAGFSCDNYPLSIFRTVVGRPKSLNGGYGYTEYDVLIGEDAEDQIEDYDLSAPVVDGAIVQWDNMERIWHRIMFKELRVAPEDRTVFLTCPSKTPIAEKIKTCEVWLETLNVPAICIQPSAALAMFSHGHSTGMAIEIGYDTTQVTPVFEGACIKFANIQTGYAGRQYNNYIKLMLKKRGIDLRRNPNRAIDKLLKEIASVSPNASMKRTGYRRYLELDNSDVEVSNENFMAAEMFFQPHLVNPDDNYIVSVQKAVLKSFSRCDEDLRPELIRNVVVAGGLALVPGLAKRLEIELNEMLESPVTISVSDEANVSSWMGGAIFAGVTEAECFWVTNKQYKEQGCKIIQRRFAA